MIKGSLIHPQILAALGRGGHSSKVLITDGNYPHWTKRGPNAEVVFLNLAPGVISCTDALKGARQRGAHRSGRLDGLREDWPLCTFGRPTDLERLPTNSQEAGATFELGKIERFKFYDVASTPEVCLTIATGEQRIYANLLLTIGVVKPKA